MISTLLRVPSTYLSERLTPLSGGIRDGAHPRVASPPPCPGPAAARSGARARPWPTISGSGSRCSSRRTPTGSCAFHLFVLSASCRPPPVFVMQSTDAPHLHHSALTRQLHSPRLGCVFRQR